MEVGKSEEQRRILVLAVYRMENRPKIMENNWSNKQQGNQTVSLSSHTPNDACKHESSVHFAATNGTSRLASIRWIPTWHVPRSCTEKGFIKSSMISCLTSTKWNYGNQESYQGDGSDRLLRANDFPTKHDGVRAFLVGQKCYLHPTKFPVSVRIEFWFEARDRTTRRNGFPMEQKVATQNFATQIFANQKWGYRFFLNFENMMLTTFTSSGQRVTYHTCYVGWHVKFTGTELFPLWRHEMMDGRPCLVTDDYLGGTNGFPTSSNWWPPNCKIWNLYVRELLDPKIHDKGYGSPVICDL
jgi:hypothetical protein